MAGKTKSLLLGNPDIIPTCAVKDVPVRIVSRHVDMVARTIPKVKTKSFNFLESKKIIETRTLLPNS